MWPRVVTPEYRVDSLLDLVFNAKVNGDVDFTSPVSETALASSQVDLSLRQNCLILPAISAPAINQSLTVSPHKSNVMKT
jgi:hypothetical protein